jgi:hypothetical protein
MRLNTIAIFLIGLMLAAAGAANSAPPSQPAPPPAIVKLAGAVVNASNADDASALSELYTKGAVVVDEIQPFLWSAPEPESLGGEPSSRSRRANTNASNWSTYALASSNDRGRTLTWSNP